MKLIRIVLHHLIKEQGIKKATLNTSESLLPVNETTEEFAKSVIQSYGKKYPTYGVFEGDSKKYPFQSYLSEYIKSKKPEDFLKFSLRSMDKLSEKIESKTTTGGYVVFFHYEEKQQEYMVTLMLDKTIRFSVDDEDLSLKKLLSLDLEKLARANRVDIQKWNNKEEQYLSFIKGTRQISHYFQDFIGSTDMTSSKENSDNLKYALQSYFKENNYTNEDKEAVNQKIKDYIHERVAKKEDVEIKSISALINIKEPDHFLEFLNENSSLEVSGAFRVTNKSHYKFLYKSIIKEKGYTLEFNNELKKSGKITIQDDKIIINNVNPEVISSL